MKYRKQLIYGSERIKFLNNVCMEIGMRNWFEFDAIGTDGEHVHIFVGAAPRYSPSRVMQIVKSITAREFFKQYPRIKKQLWGGEFWSDGGYIGTVGDGSNSRYNTRLCGKTGNERRKRWIYTDEIV